MTTAGIAQVSRTGHRPVNEDYADVLQVGDVTCCVLADGLGGHRGGEVASRVAVEAALASFRDSPDVSVDSVEAHIDRANRAILERQQQEPSVAHMRSTIVVLVVGAEQMVWGHVGDSRLYYIQGARVAARTKDHSVSQALVDAGEVAAYEQGRHEDRSRLLRSLGKDSNASPTVQAVQHVYRGDGFLICSDGFWEGLSDAEIAIDYCASVEATEWLARLESRISRRIPADKDNFTAIALRVSADTLPEPPPQGDRPRPQRGIEAAVPPVSWARRGRAIAGGGLLLLAVVGLWAGLSIARRIEGWWSPTPPASRAVPETTAVKPPTRPDGPQAGHAASGAPSSPNGPQPGQVASAAPSSPAPDDRKPMTSSQPYSGPGDLPEGRVYRPADRAEYKSIEGAIEAAADGETIWIAKGRFVERLQPIAKRLTLKGAGRDKTHLDLSSGTGIVLSADDGGLEDLELCCARRGPVLEIGGQFAGTITRTRIRDGHEVGILVRDRARPRITENEIVGNRKGKVSVVDAALPRIE